MTDLLVNKLELYPFQEALVTKHVEVTNTLVGDDMGLGKTIEAIEIDRRKRKRFAKDFIAKHKGKPLTLVVTPLTVTGSWQKHYAKWAPELKTYTIDPKNRNGFLEAVRQGEADVFICHWEAMRLIEGLRNIMWFHIIADEAHRIKNRKAQQSLALKRLWTTNKLALSGTPADNRPDDFWSVLNWLWPMEFSSFWRFRNYHLLIKRHDKGNNCGCDKWHEKAWDEILGCAHVEELMQRIEFFYTRRLKEDVLEDLPDKYYEDVYVDLAPAQRRAYNEMKKHMLAWVGKHENEPIAAPVVISQLQRLQQFGGAYGRITQAFRKKKDCKLCLAGKFGLNKCTGHWVDQLLLEEPSTKLDAVMEIISDNPNKQIVVFSQSKQMIYMLQRRLEKRRITSAILTGDTPQGNQPGERDDLVARFQRGDYRVFGATIRAGGEGITLTAASTCIFLDRDWSPSKNRQAEDRLHRIGQQNAVHIINIIGRNTVEPRRNEKIELKWGWLKEILGDTQGECK